MNDKLTVGARVGFCRDTLPSGMRQRLGNAQAGTVTEVTWNYRIGVKPDGATAVQWFEAMDLQEVPA